MSTSRELVAELLAAGMSKAELARAVGRDSSVISQIESGRKPYANLAPTLEALRDNRVRGDHRVVPAAPRRVGKSGRPARVRGRTSLVGGRTVRVGRQAVASGARSIYRRLEEAAAAGLVCAFTVTYPHRYPRRHPNAGQPVVLGKSPKYQPPKPSHHPKMKAKPSVVELGAAGRGFPCGMWVRLADEHGGSIGAALSAWITAQGLGDVDGLLPTAIEMRTWTP